MIPYCDLVIPYQDPTVVFRITNPSPTRSPRPPTLRAPSGGSIGEPLRGASFPAKGLQELLVDVYVYIYTHRYTDLQIYIYIYTYIYIYISYRYAYPCPYLHIHIYVLPHPRPCAYIFLSLQEDTYKKQTFLGRRRSDKHFPTCGT